MIRHLTRTPDTARNRAQWLSIADFLVRQNFREVMRARLRSEAAGAGREGDEGAHAACAGADSLEQGA